MEGDLLGRDQTGLIGISIHALRVEGDFLSFDPVGEVLVISIHALRVEGDLRRWWGSARRTDFYPRPPGGGRPEHSGIEERAVLISIHALRVEGDGIVAGLLHGVQEHFYPRPPGGGRRDNVVWLVDLYQFLSTPSGWRATHVSMELRELTKISIHALRVEGDFRFVYNVDFFSTISIHALRVEGDNAPPL